MNDGYAKIKMDEVKRHLDTTYFAWIGGTASASIFYYRIHSPVVLIEFDHQRPANLRGTGVKPTYAPTHPHGGPHPNGTNYAKTCGASTIYRAMAADILRSTDLVSHQCRRHLHDSSDGMS